MQVAYTQSHFFNSFFAILIEGVRGKFFGDQHTENGRKIFSSLKICTQYQTHPATNWKSPEYPNSLVPF